MATVEEQLLSILNNSVKGGELPVLTTTSGTEYQLLYNPSTKRIERVLISNSNYFVTISGVVFRLIKGYQGSVINVSSLIEFNDYLTDGIIRISGYNIDIIRAKYLGGDITNFGTYDPNNGTFTGGNYDILEHREA